jgi:hypothetical protein
MAGERVADAAFLNAVADSRAQGRTRTGTKERIERFLEAVSARKKE